MQRRKWSSENKLKIKNGSIFLPQVEIFFILCPILSVMAKGASAISKNLLVEGCFVRFLLGFFEGAYR